MSRVIALANQKGGVGKTTTAINLAAVLAANGQKTLVVDFDPQGNATTGLGARVAQPRAGTYELLFNTAPDPSLAFTTGVPRLVIIPASPDLAAAEVDLAVSERREYRLKDALDAMSTDATTTIIDCPPSLGLLTLNALVAADAVLIPLQCEFFALEGISHLIRTIDRVKRRLNARLGVQGIVLTMYDGRNNLSELVASDARSFFGSQVYETVIPRSIRVSEAPSHGLPVVLYDHRSRGAQAYIKFAGEFLQRETQHARA